MRSAVAKEKTFHGDDRKHPQSVVVIYTDGACSGNPGPGGWGAILNFSGTEKEISGGTPDTTNNRMELTAAIEALKTLKVRSTVALYTDSRYVKDGMLSWLATWKANSWRTASKKPVKNVDLWQELDALVQKHQVSWHWVKAHNDDPLNERADQLARSAIIGLLMGTKNPPA